MVTNIKKKRRKEEGQMIVESAFYFPIVIIVVWCIAMLSLAKLDTCLVEFQSAELANKYVNYIESDGLKEEDLVVNMDLSIGTASRVGEGTLAGYYGRTSRITNLFPNTLSKRGIMPGQSYWTRRFGDSNQRARGYSDVQQFGINRIKDNSTYQTDIPAIFRLLGIEGRASKEQGLMYAVSADEAELLRISTWSNNAEAFQYHGAGNRDEQRNWVRGIVRR